MTRAGRRRRLLTRAAPVVLIALAAFGLGALAGASDGDESPAERFARAWEQDDIEAMYAELAPGAQQDHPLPEFRRAYRTAARTATLESVVATDAGRERGVTGPVAMIEVRLATHAFGEVAGEVGLPLSDAGIDWAPHLVFPGLEPGEVLARRTRGAPRAPILALDGSALARGPVANRALPLGPAASAVVGEVGEPAPRVERRLEARGFPPGTLAGVSGLELAYDERLAGVPGGELVAVDGPDAPPNGGRLLASSDPQRGEPVRTTIDPDLQQAAVAGLGGLFGGIAVLDARRGAVRALAGVAFTAPQPPGSTFKVVTAVAALDAGAVEPDDEFPVEVSNAAIGREIFNSGRAPCGGDLIQSFARSCNTVFAPLGVEAGGDNLVAVAEGFGFNSEPTLHDAEATAAIDPPASTLPRQLEDSVAVGETALGQGQVLATPLQMASIAQTIANDGVRMPTRMVRGKLAPPGEPVEVTSPETAEILREMMVAVVQDGTGAAAALPDVQVAGKTGTAELGPTPLSSGDDGVEPELDAWFIAFAPARDPQLAIAVMIVNSDGDGGEIAAPIAREVLAAAFSD